MTAWEDSRRPRVVKVDGDFPGARLQRMWETAPGLKGWLSSVDHKEIGKRYIITAFAFLILGGLE
ncbi:MAG TPA: hypothetical protein VIJ59_11310, partial [Caulobacteraceae bacterium]